MTDSAPRPTRFASRRAFLRLSGLAGAAALLAACSPSAPAAQPTAAPAKPAGAAPTAAPAAPAAKPTTAPVAPAAAKPTAAPAAAAKPTAAPKPAAAAGNQKRGGTLTWGQWDSNEGLDPATPSGASALEVLTNMLDGLVAMDASGKIVPWLATKWTIDEDSKRYTFTLRDDVTFHDGTQLTSQAVKGSIERILDPATKAGGVVGLLGPIDKVEAPNPQTVVFTFKNPNPLFLQSMWRAYFGPLSPKQLEASKPGEPIKNPIGTGPFKFVNRSADGVVTLEANAEYTWGSELLQNRGAPYIQTLKFRSIPEDATRVATLESGENLVIDEVSEPDFARMKADNRFSFLETPRRGIALGFNINVGKAPTDDLAVRQAINYAVDRKSIVDRLFFGVHKVAVGPLSEGVWARWDEAEKMYGYDPKKAQEVLETAGWKAGAGGIREKDGQKLAMDIATFRSPWGEMAEALQSQFRAVGIDLQVKKMERGPYLDYVRNYQHNLCASAGTNIDPSELRLRFHSSGIKRANFANTQDKELDALLDKGQTQALGSEERRQTYIQAQQWMMKNLPFVSIMSQVRVEGMSARVKDLKMGPDGLNALPLLDTWIDA